MVSMHTRSCTVDSYVLQCKKHGDWAKVYNLLTTHGCRMSMKSFNVAIDACGKAGKLREAFELF